MVNSTYQRVFDKRVCNERLFSEKAHSEYNKYKEKIKNSITQVEKDFIKQIENKIDNFE